MRRYSFKQACDVIISRESSKQMQASSDIQKQTQEMQEDTFKQRNKAMRGFSSNQTAIFKKQIQAMRGYSSATQASKCKRSFKCKQAIGCYSIQASECSNKSNTSERACKRGSHILDTSKQAKTPSKQAIIKSQASKRLHNQSIKYKNDRIEGVFTSSRSFLLSFSFNNKVFFSSTTTGSRNFWRQNAVRTLSSVHPS